MPPATSAVQLRRQNFILRNTIFSYETGLQDFQPDKIGYNSCVASIESLFMIDNFLGGDKSAKPSFDCLEPLLLRVVAMARPAMPAWPSLSCSACGSFMTHHGNFCGYRTCTNLLNLKRCHCSHSSAHNGERNLLQGLTICTFFPSGFFFT